jgi:type IV pilus assembly protein PilY1
MATAGGNVDYHERWVAFLSGGFDPMGLRGRGVHMVDVWTGTELFDFSLPTSGCTNSTDPRCQLKAPIASTVGMVMWGTSESANTSFGNQGFFDTATFGDTAGQIWTLRFSDPGELDSGTKLASNWFGGRAFQVTGCSNQPFFYITANAQVPGGWLRTYAGTGDRYNLLDLYGGTCGPDNLRACAERGCTVTVGSSTDSTANTMACSAQGRETDTLSLSSCGSSNAYFSSTSRTTSSVAACTLEGKAYVYIDCGGGGSNVKNVTKNVRYSCADTSLTNGLLCGATTNNPGATLDLDDANNIVQKSNWYFSMRVFDTVNRTIFRTLPEATTYDQNRLTVTGASSASPGVVLIDGGVDAPTPVATSASNGWAMYFNHDGTRTADGHDYTVSRYDERVSSTTALAGLMSWNTIQPGYGSVVRSSGKQSCQVAKCTAENRRVAYHYAADPVTGGSVMLDASGNLVRSTSSTTLVPAMGDQPTVFVNQKGQVQVALTAVNPERGASNVTTGIQKDPAPSYGVVPVSRGLHDCRHSAGAPPDSACK